MSLNAFLFCCALKIKKLLNWAQLDKVSLYFALSWCFALIWAILSFITEHTSIGLSVALETMSDPFFPKCLLSAPFIWGTFSISFQLLAWNCWVRNFPAFGIMAMSQSPHFCKLFTIWIGACYFNPRNAICYSFSLYLRWTFSISSSSMSNIALVLLPVFFQSLLFMGLFCLLW